MKKIAKYTAYTIVMYYLNIAQFSHALDRRIELGQTNLELSGTVTTSTCGILSSEQDKYIDLGTVTSQRLVSAGSQSTPVPIHFEMNNCPPNSAITIMFNGTQDQENAELLAIEDRNNKAENIAIEISDQNKKRLALGENSQPFIVDNEGKISALFYANYFATKAQAKAGIANANAQVSIQYD